MSAQAIDHAPAVIEIDKVLPAETLAQLLTGDERPGSLQQQRQGLQLLLLQRDPDPGLAQHAGAEIELEDAEPGPKKTWSARFCHDYFAAGLEIGRTGRS
jgi:hypothetical protein